MNTLRDQLRRGVVARSIDILRGHGKEDAEIRAILLRDFAIGKETLDGLLRAHPGADPSTQTDR